MNTLVLISMAFPKFPEDIPLHKMNQAEIKKFEYISHGLDKGGVCLGFCFDYTRFLLANSDNPKNYSYPEKFNQKLKLIGTEKFFQRISIYQSNVDTQGLKEQPIKVEDLDYAQMIEEQKEVKDRTVIGFQMAGASEAHIISLRLIKDSKGIITGYKIFDPNIGEFDCTLEKPEKNKENFNVVMTLITYGVYDDKLNHSLADIEGIMRKNNLITKGEQKYLVNNRKGSYYSQDPEEFVDLIDHGVDLNIQPADLTRVLYFSFLNNKPYLTNKIIKHPIIDSMINNKDSKGLTALMYAIDKQYVDATMTLLNHPKIDLSLKCDHPKYKGMNAYTIMKKTWDNIPNEIEQAFEAYNNKILTKDTALGSDKKPKSNVEKIINQYEEISQPDKIEQPSRTNGTRILARNTEIAPDGQPKSPVQRIIANYEKKSQSSKKIESRNSISKI